MHTYIGQVVRSTTQPVHSLWTKNRKSAMQIRSMKFKRHWTFARQVIDAIGCIMGTGVSSVFRSYYMLETKSHKVPHIYEGTVLNNWSSPSFD